MKPVNQRLAGSVILMFVLTLLAMIEKITKKTILTETLLIIIGIITIPIIIFISGKLSKGYNETEEFEETDDGVFWGTGILLFILCLYFVLSK